MIADDLRRRHGKQNTTQSPLTPQHNVIPGFLGGCVKNNDGFCIKMMIVCGFQVYRSVRFVDVLTSTFGEISSFQNDGFLNENDGFD